MSDYPLHNLSPRSFETLVQALALKILGPGIVVYGDGPDGGREATFKGRLSYPNQAAAWSGYCVLQAKFLQRPGSTHQQAQWAASTLETELKEFTNQRTTRRVPEYYIFATNAILSSVPDGGGKARVDAVFEKFAPVLSLKDYAVWDYDQIRAFLDADEDVRRRYLAWIAPGDVLAAVADHVDFVVQDFETVIGRFLEKEFVSQQYANLEHAGHAPDDRVPLARVFVDLPVAPEPRSVITRISDSNLDTQPSDISGFASAMIAVAANSFSIADSARTGRSQNYEHVLVGGPGQGKSTLCQFLCQSFRATILRRLNRRLAQATADGIADLDKQAAIELIPQPSVGRFPFLVGLSDFAAYLATEPDLTLLAYLVGRIRARTDSAVSAHDLRSWLGAYPWLLVLDGLDEVPPSSNRDLLLEALEHFWIDATEVDADIVTIATTRPQGYGMDFRRGRHHYLQPLTDADALHYSIRLNETRYPDRERRQKINERLQRAVNDPSAGHLMHSPLQVTIMATLVDRMDPPKERWNLFKEYYNVIYLRELEREIPAAEVLRTHRTDVDTIHRRAGLILQIESERSGGTDATLSREQFADIIRSRLEEEEYAADALDELTALIIEAAALRLVFLVGLETDAIGFELRSLQEFMAADEILNARDVDVRSRFMEIAPRSHWRNVFLFATGKCFSEREHLRDVIHTICAELNEAPDMPLERESREGARLALDILEDGAARQKPRDARLLARQACGLLDLPPEQDHTRLAMALHVAQPQVLAEEIKRRLASRDFYSSLGAWAAALSVAAEDPEIAEIAESAMPVSNRERLDLLRIANDVDVPWLWPRLGPEVIPVTRPSELMGVLREWDSAPSSLSDGPAWFERTTQALRQEALRSGDTVRVALKMSEPRKSSISLEVGPLRMNAAAVEEAMAEVPSSLPEWRLLACAARFGADPTPEVLGNELHALADHYVPDLGYFAARWHSIPWPLAASVVGASDEQTLKASAELAAGGDLGSTADWEEAESRWLRDGVVTKGDLLAERGDLRALADMGDAGFPFAASSWLITLDRGLCVQTFHELANSFFEAKSDAARSVISQLAVAVAASTSSSGYGYERETDEPYSFVRFSRDTEVVFRQAFSDPRQLDVDAVSALRWPDSAERKAALLDYLNEEGYRGVRRGTENRFATRLATEFQRAPHLRGLLPVIAGLAGNQAVGIPIELLFRDSDPPVVDRAAVELTLREIGSSVGNARAVARDLSRLCETDPEFVEDVLSEWTPDPRQATREVWARLVNDLPSAEWRSRGLAIARVRDEVRSRRTRFGEASVWREMSFPEGLRRVLRRAI